MAKREVCGVFFAQKNLLIFESYEVFHFFGNLGSLMSFREEQKSVATVLRLGLKMKTLDAGHEVKRISKKIKTLQDMKESTMFQSKQRQSTKNREFKDVQGVIFGKKKSTIFCRRWGVSRQSQAIHQKVVFVRSENSAAGYSETPCLARRGGVWGWLLLGLLFFFFYFWPYH